MKLLSNFFSFVEIKTKIASVVPFLVGAGYTIYRNGSLDRYKTLVFFVAMLIFDMTATAINNHVGTRQQKLQNHYSNGVSRGIILFMLTASAVLGIYLVSITGIVVLLTGIICFGIGILYSFGPLPIARTPFGEIFSGMVMGTGIPFLVYIINDPELLSLQLALPRVMISADLVGLISLGIVVLPLICCISNIMLANNICDVEEDIKVKRYTLVYYIGKDSALKLFQLLYLAALLFIVVGAVTAILPPTALLGVIGFLLVWKNIRIFFEKQSKRETFEVAIKNFILILIPYTVGIWLGVWIF